MSGLCGQSGWLPESPATSCTAPPGHSGGHIATGVGPVPARQFAADDWTRVRGQPLATFRGVPGLDPRLLAGQLVEIDGHVYRVRGVETHAIPDATGKPFGLLVDREGSP